MRITEGFEQPHRLNGPGAGFRAQQAVGRLAFAQAHTAADLVGNTVGVARPVVGHHQAGRVGSQVDNPDPA